MSVQGEVPSTGQAGEGDGATPAAAPSLFEQFQADVKSQQEDAGPEASGASPAGVVREGEPPVAESTPPPAPEASSPVVADRALAESFDRLLQGQQQLEQQRGQLKGDIDYAKEMRALEQNFAADPVSAFQEAAKRWAGGDERKAKEALHALYNHLTFDVLGVEPSGDQRQLVQQQRLAAQVAQQNRELAEMRAQQERERQEAEQRQHEQAAVAQVREYLAPEVLAQHKELAAWRDLEKAAASSPAARVAWNAIKPQYQPPEQLVWNAIKLHYQRTGQELTVSQAAAMVDREIAAWAPVSGLFTQGAPSAPTTTANLPSPTRATGASPTVGATTAPSAPSVNEEPKTHEERLSRSFALLREVASRQ